MGKIKLLNAFSDVENLGFRETRQATSAFDDIRQQVINLSWNTFNESWRPKNDRVNWWYQLRWVSMDEGMKRNRKGRTKENRIESPRCRQNAFYNSDETYRGAWCVSDWLLPGRQTTKLSGCQTRETPECKTWWERARNNPKTKFRWELMSWADSCPRKMYFCCDVLWWSSWLLLINQ